MITFALELDRFRVNTSNRNHPDQLLGHPERATSQKLRLASTAQHPETGILMFTGMGAAHYSGTWFNARSQILVELVWRLGAK